MDPAVLVLNQNYEPLNVCNAKRAIVLVMKGKAEVLEQNHKILRSVSGSVHCPSVIRLVYMIKKPRPVAKLTRREIFIRDNYTCQYCGTKTKDLTLDHVIPKHKGGQHTWENLVSACKECNHRKGSKSLQETGFKLHRQPFEPRVNNYYVVYRYLDGSANDEWLKFVPEPRQPRN